MDFWVTKIFTPSGFVRENILAGAGALDVGCGPRKLPGATGMDIRNVAGVDIVHDANKFPWPVEPDSFDLVFFNQSLEHVENVPKTLEEAFRILRPGGRIVIQVPYFRSVDAFVDPTHEHFFTSKTLDFIPDFKFKVIGFWYGWPHQSRNPLRQAFKNFIHRLPFFYDKYLSLIIPVECLTWELEAKK